MQLDGVPAKYSRLPVRVPFRILLGGWTVILLVLVGWNYNTIETETFTMAKREAYKGFEKDVMLRSWATQHGGVYVPITETTQPNPYLSDNAERDIVTPSGKKLTLLNPAYITRQVHEISLKEKGIKGHITSLLPIRKENAADAWETKALTAFEQGTQEYFGFDTIGKEKYFRYMAPLFVAKGCLNCHAFQGYKIGEIRGGISSSVPWRQYEASILAQSTNIVLGYGIIWLIGFIGITAVKKRFIIYISHRDAVESEMSQLNNALYKSKQLIEENLLQKNALVEELKDTKSKLERINSEKDKFFSILAHDLKSPLHGFLGLTEMMAKDVTYFSREEVAEISKNMNSSAHNLYKLLQNLLEWARMQDGTVEFNPQELPLLEIVTHNKELIQKTSELKNIAVNIKIPADINITADKDMLNSILRNLLSNAIKFTASGGKIEICAYKTEKGFIEVSVRDTGIGIPDYLLQKLFIIGEKVGRKGTENEESTGLGLMLCKEFLEKHSGKIWVESTEGAGSTFYFSLPNA